MKNKLLPLSLILVLSYIIISCGKEEEKPLPIETKKETQVDTAKNESKTISYTSLTLTGATQLRKLLDSFSYDQLLLIQKINRLDLAHFRQGYVLMIPSDFTDSSSLSPYPFSISTLDSIPKILFVNRRIQAFGAYQNGKLIHWGPTSTGKRKTPTPPGLYFTNWKKELAHSTVNNEWDLPWNFNIANFDGISLHQFDLPGYPASHSCVRLLKEDAMWFFTWGDEWVLSKNGSSIEKYGTPVIVFDEYDYKLKKPLWKNLNNSPVTASTNRLQLDSIFNIHKDEIAKKAR